jgi:hypothetical protein
MKPEDDNTAEKKVILLGAGASNGSRFRLPVMNEFFAGFQPDTYPRLAEYLYSRFGVPFDNLNLEDVVTQMEISRDGLGAKWQAQGVRISAARRELDAYIRRQLACLDDGYPHDLPKDGSCELQEKIFLSLRPNCDSIISLNYDLIADYTLKHIDKSRRPSEQYGLFQRAWRIVGKVAYSGGGISTVHKKDRERGHYLKLHGSLDWLYCSDVNCGNHQVFHVDVEDACHPDGVPCSLCGSQLVSVIIPPSMNKSLELYPKMGLVWNLAFRELSHASHWIMIGMSLPDSDIHLKWLLREAAVARDRRLKLTVVNTKEDACERAESLLGVKPLFVRGIEEYAEQCGKPT